jgi:hypothetical protein
MTSWMSTTNINLRIQRHKTLQLLSSITSSSISVVIVTGQAMNGVVQEQSKPFYKKLGIVVHDLNFLIRKEMFGSKFFRLFGSATWWQRRWTVQEIVCARRAIIDAITSPPNKPSLSRFSKEFSESRDVAQFIHQIRSAIYNLTGEEMFDAIWRT